MMKNTLKGLENLMNQIEQANNLADHVAGTEKATMDVFDEMMKDMSPEQKADVSFFKAQANRALNMAKRGDMGFVEVIKNAQDQIVKKKQDGGNNNG